MLDQLNKKRERFKRQGYSFSPWSCNCAFQLITGFMFPSQEFIDQNFVEQKSADNILLPHEILPFSHVRYGFSMLHSAMLPHTLGVAINPQCPIPLVCGPKKHHWCLQKLIDPLELQLMRNTLCLVTSCVSEHPSVEAFLVLWKHCWNGQSGLIITISSPINQYFLQHHISKGFCHVSTLQDD